MERLQRTLAEIKRHIEALDTEEGLSDINDKLDRVLEVVDVSELQHSQEQILSEVRELQESVTGNKQSLKRKLEELDDKGDISEQIEELEGKVDSLRADVDEMKSVLEEIRSAVQELQ